MAIVVPSRRQRESTLSKISQALNIGQSVLGIGLAIPKFLQDRETAKQNQEYREGLMAHSRERLDMQQEQMDATAKNRKEQLDLSKKSQLPHAYQVIDNPNLKVDRQWFEGATKQPTREGTTLWVARKADDEDDAITTDQYVRSFMEVPEGTKHSLPIKVKMPDGSTRVMHSKKFDKKAVGAIDPDKLLAQAIKVQEALEAHLDTRYGYMTSRPVLGKVVAGVADYAGVKTDEAVELNTRLYSVISGMVKMFQGGRPSDFDYEVALDALKPQPGEMPNVQRTKLRAMVKILNIWTDESSRKDPSDIAADRIIGDVFKKNNIWTDEEIKANYKPEAVKAPSHNEAGNY